jgi:hypothetical protein
MNPQAWSNAFSWAAVVVPLVAGLVMARNRFPKFAIAVPFLLAAISGGALYFRNVVTAEKDAQLENLKARTISAKQRAQIVELLMPDRIIKGRVLINPAMEGEAWQFGEDIKNTLKEAGFEVDDVPFGARILALNKAGLYMWIKDKNSQPKHGGPIVKAFAAAGIDMVGEVDDSVPDASTVVIVISSHR